MGKIFYIMGKSATGKDTIYANLLSRKELNLTPFVMHTTRPRRANETDGVQYHFVSVERMRQMELEGKIIERRAYDTVQGIWYYFTADDGTMACGAEDYLMLGTLESYQKIRDYFGPERVLPIYIEVEDCGRLERSIKREKKQASPDFSEVCRRYLADQQDFSEEKIAAAGIARRFHNDASRELCMEEIASFIRSKQ